MQIYTFHPKKTNPNAVKYVTFFYKIVTKKRLCDICKKTFHFQRKKTTIKAKKTSVKQ